MSRAMLSERGTRPHLSVGGIADLRLSVEDAFDTLESQDGYPLLVRLYEGAYGIDLSDVGNGDGFFFPVGGRNLLQGQEFAELFIPSTAEGDGDNSLYFLANKPGAPSNDFTVEILEATNGESLAITYDPDFNTFTIQLSSTPSDNNADAVESEWNWNSEDAWKYATCFTMGSDPVAPRAATHFEGGTGAGFHVSVGRAEQDVLWIESDTYYNTEWSFVVVYVDNNPYNWQDGDRVDVSIVSNGIPTSNTLPVDLWNGGGPFYGYQGNPPRIPNKDLLKQKSEAWIAKVKLSLEKLKGQPKKIQQVPKVEEPKIEKPAKAKKATKATKAKKV